MVQVVESQTNSTKVPSGINDCVGNVPEATVIFKKSQYGVLQKLWQLQYLWGAATALSITYIHAIKQLYALDEERFEWCRNQLASLTPGTTVCDMDDCYEVVELLTLRRSVFIQKYIAVYV